MALSILLDHFHFSRIRITFKLVFLTRLFVGFSLFTLVVCSSWWTMISLMFLFLVLYRTIGQMLAKAWDCDFIDADDFHPQLNKGIYLTSGTHKHSSLWKGEYLLARATSLLNSYELVYYVVCQIHIICFSMSTKLERKQLRA